MVCGIWAATCGSGQITAFQVLVKQPDQRAAGPGGTAQRRCTEATYRLNLQRHQWSISVSDVQRVLAKEPCAICTAVQHYRVKRHALQLRDTVLYVTQQTLRGILHQIQDLIKAVCAAIVGVWDHGAV